KTVAFGTLIAETLLGPRREGAPERPRGAPRALVVAPTRELANQVSQELTWLLAPAKLTLGAFTGGTSVPGDLRRLRMGIDIAVGTPGRLVDLEKRGALDLSAIESLVLDEADEMLDLGFREALEHLLGVAPKERRTLLFSATMPSDINRMAATYMREPMRVDARAKGMSTAHADIEYFAHLVRPQDRLAAVVNVLLGNPGKAIVFCRTREGVGELHQRLVDHGFRAAAISGDRAQGERDRALGALRSGRARILVATNVAARGLDLPDVELVLHADLPENAESLTHRSGRTGRAGRKGKSVVIADMRERRKAERLLGSARTQARWTSPPTAHDVRRALIDGLRSELLESVSGELEGDDESQSDNITGDDARTESETNLARESAVGASDKAARSKTRVVQSGGGGLLPEEAAELADRLRAALPDRVLIASLLGRELARLPAPMPLQPINPSQRPEAPRLTTNVRAGRERADRNEPSGPTGDGGVYGTRGTYGRSGWNEAVLFRVNLGASANAEPGWLLPLICRRGGVTRREVGAIRVGATSSTFEISAEAAADFAAAAAERDPRAPNVTIEAAGEGAGHVAPVAPASRDSRPTRKPTNNHRDERPARGSTPEPEAAFAPNARRTSDGADETEARETPRAAAPERRDEVIEAPVAKAPALAEPAMVTRSETADGHDNDASAAPAVEAPKPRKPKAAKTSEAATVGPRSKPAPARAEAQAPVAIDAIIDELMAAEGGAPAPAKAARTVKQPFVEEAAALTGPGRGSAAPSPERAQPYFANLPPAADATDKKPLRVERAPRSRAAAPAKTVTAKAPESRENSWDRPRSGPPARPSSRTHDEGANERPRGSFARSAGGPADRGGGGMRDRDRGGPGGKPGFSDRGAGPRSGGFGGSATRGPGAAGAGDRAFRDRPAPGPRAGGTGFRDRPTGGNDERGGPRGPGGFAGGGRFGGVRRDAGPGARTGRPERGPSDERGPRSGYARPTGARFSPRPGAPARPTGRTNDRPP
ncbi:MAG TPA: DEAD/DEAH box helicase, partial [Polyangia bacterium]